MLTTGSGELRTWAVPDLEVIAPDAVPSLENEVYSDSQRLIRLDAAANEVVAFQLLLAAGNTKIGVEGVRVEDFRSSNASIPAEHVHIYRQAWVPLNEYPAWYLRLTPEIQTPREFADPLIPLTAPAGALPMSIAPGHCEALWIEVRVPATTQPGTYRSSLQLTATGAAARALSLSLEVWPFAVPQTRHLAMLCGLNTATILRHHLEVSGKAYAPVQLTADDPAYRPATAVLDATLQLLHEHRCSPVLRDIHPLRRVGANGQMELEWSDYDRLVSSFVDGTAFEDRAAAPAWPIPADDREPSPEAYGGWGSPTYDRMLIDYLRACAEHFLKLGWLDRHFVWMPLPGPTDADRYRQFEHLGRLVRQADTRLRLVCELPPEPMAAYGWRSEPYQDLRNYAGIWCPPASLLDPEALGRQLSAGRPGWLRPDSPPYAGSLALFAPACHARSLPWQAYRYGLSGILLANIDTWPEDGSYPASDTENVLIWPGKAYGLSGPIPSVRLKRLLRGVQDYEYLWLLEHNRRPGIARLIAEDLFAFGGTAAYGEHLLDGRPGGWARDPQAWGLARRLMARELAVAMDEGGSAGASAEDVSAFQQQIEWGRLAQAIRQVRGCVDGVRLQMDPENKTAPLRVALTLSLFNGTRKLFSGTPTLVPLPDGWTGGEPALVENLAPLQTIRRTVRAAAAVVPCNHDGVMTLGVSLSGRKDDGPVVPARLCAITSQRLDKPINLDGKLNDWPLGLNNVAGDFVLVGSTEMPKQQRVSPDRPTLPTLAFAGHDGTYLYLAFNCQDDRLSDRRMSRSNAVAYDGLWPSGEDCLEIVLDPTGQAVDPGDLYHIIVKANGAVISERGATCLERVARHEQWLGGVTAAIDDESQPNRWTAEIRIPLASLGKLAPIWGINFARYHPRLGEYSAWTAVRSYLYSPVSLGNIQLGK